MIKYKQKVFGVKGSCFKTCVACLMNVSLSEVPNFILRGPDWFRHCHNWFARRGYDIYITTYKKELHSKKKLIIVGGRSPRYDCGHAVIYYAGKPYHDPHPDNTFIVGEPTHVYVIKRNRNAKIWTR